MQQKKQKPAAKRCTRCGRETLGKYAAKNHVCSQRDIDAYSRDVGMAAQRAERRS